MITAVQPGARSTAVRDQLRLVGLTAGERGDDLRKRRPMMVRVAWSALGMDLTFCGYPVTPSRWSCLLAVRAWRSCSRVADAIQ
jgi:hypothetical protein